MPVVLIILAGMLWGTTGTAQAFAPDGAQPMAIGAIRLAIGGLTLLGLVYLKGKLKIEHLSYRETFIAAVSMAAFQPLFFNAVALTGIAVGTIVAIGSAPILAGFIEWFFRKKAPSSTWWVATVLAIAGCTLLFSQPHSAQEVVIDSFGLSLALAAGLAFAVYTIMNKKLVEKSPPETVVAIIFTLSAILLMPVLFAYDVAWVASPLGIGVMLHLGILTTAVAYICFSKGLKNVTAATAVTLSLAEPLTAALLGVLVVGESLSSFGWIGVSMILIGLVVVGVKRHRLSG